MLSRFKAGYNVILASYPKSGNTWMKFIFSHLYSIKDVQVDFQNVEELIPGVMRPWRLVFRKKTLDPSFFKSHSHYVKSNRKYRNIYIVRDPRDVYLSYYHYLGGDKDLSHFPWFMVNYEFPFGRWSEHVKSWLKHKNDDHVAIVKYEDLLVDPNAVLEQIVSKLSLPSTKEERADAISNSTFTKMKDNAQRTFKEGKTPFVRKGISGEWRSDFSLEAEEVFCKYEDVSLLKEFDYPSF